MLTPGTLIKTKYSLTLFNLDRTFFGLDAITNAGTLFLVLSVITNAETELIALTVMSDDGRTGVFRFSGARTLRDCVYEV